MTRRLLAAALAILVSSGCYRTLYRNLQPHNATPVVEDAESLRRRPRANWQSYFMYGWFPSERVIDANLQCGEGHVATIETEQTFGQGAIAWAVMLGFYLGIYSPWSAQVSCDHTIRS